MSSVSKHQFGNYMMSEEDFNFGEGSTNYTRFKLYREPTAEEGSSHWESARDVGSLEVAHYPARSHTQMPGPLGDAVHGQPGGTAPGTPPEMTQRGYNEHWARRTALTPSMAEGEGGVVGQIPLFKHVSTHANDTVDLMSVPKESRHMVGTMLGVAGNRAIANTGRPLAAPHSLSPHSQRTVQHLQSAGAVPEGHTFHSNSLDFIAPQSMGTPGGLEGLAAAMPHDNPSEKPIAASEVREGQALSRHVLRQGMRDTRISQHRELKGQGTLFT